MQENGWNFNDPNGIPGFGEIGPEVDVKTMVARIFGEAPRLADRPLRRPRELYSASAPDAANRKSWVSPTNVGCGSIKMGAWHVASHVACRNRVQHEGSKL